MLPGTLSIGGMGQLFVNELDPAGSISLAEIGRMGPLAKGYPGSMVAPL